MRGRVTWGALGALLLAAAAACERPRTQLVAVVSSDFVEPDPLTAVELVQVGDAALAAIVATPRMVAGVADAVDIACGQLHSCALSRDGSVRCWGSNSRSQLGDGTTTSSAVPVPVVF